MKAEDFSDRLHEVVRRHLRPSYGLPDSEARVKRLLENCRKLIVRSIALCERCSWSGLRVTGSVLLSADGLTSTIDIDCIGRTVDSYFDRESLRVRVLMSFIDDRALVDGALARIESEEAAAIIERESHD